MNEFRSRSADFIRVLHNGWGRRDFSSGWKFNTPQPPRHRKDERGSYRYSQNEKWRSWTNLKKQKFSQSTQKMKFSITTSTSSTFDPTISVEPPPFRVMDWNILAPEFVDAKYLAISPELLQWSNRSVCQTDGWAGWLVVCIL